MVDAFSGQITLRPDEESRTRFEQRIGYHRALQIEKRTRGLGPVRTRDGIEIQIAANVGSREEAELAAETGAVGIGLFRLEFLLMSDTELPSERELVDRLDSALDRVWDLRTDREAFIAYVQTETRGLLCESNNATESVE